MNRSVYSHLFFFSLIFLFLPGFLSAEPVIRLTGTIENTEGEPIEGAQVKLQHSSLVCTTRADGSFQLISIGTSAQKGTKQIRNLSEIRNGVLHQSFSRPGPVQVDVHDFSGRLVSSSRRNVTAPGIYRIPLGHLPKAGIVRIRHGSLDYCMRVVFHNGNGTTSRVQPKSRSIKADQSGLVGTLEVSHPEYKTTVIGIHQYIDDITVRLTSKATDTSYTDTSAATAIVLRCGNSKADCFLPCDELFSIIKVSGTGMDEQTITTASSDTLWADVPVGSSRRFSAEVFCPTGEIQATAQTEKAIRIDTTNVVVLNLLPPQVEITFPCVTCSAYVSEPIDYYVNPVKELQPPFSFSIDGPASAHIDPATGLFSWRPTLSDVGQQVIDFTITDFHGYTVTTRATYAVIMPTVSEENPITIMRPDSGAVYSYGDTLLVSFAMKGCASQAVVALRTASRGHCYYTNTSEYWMSLWQEDSLDADGRPSRYLRDYRNEADVIIGFYKVPLIDNTAPSESDCIQLDFGGGTRSIDSIRVHIHDPYISDNSTGSDCGDPYDEWTGWDIIDHMQEGVFSGYWSVVPE